METESSKNGKREYQKPKLRTIELVADEVLAVGCKMVSSKGPITPVCQGVSSCYVAGS